MQARQEIYIVVICPHGQEEALLALLERHPKVVDWDHEGETWRIELSWPDSGLLARIDAL